MNEKPSFPPFKSVAAGALAGVLVFLGLSAVKAQQTLTVYDVRMNPKAYVGTTVAVTGIATAVRAESKSVHGQAVPWIKLNLYEWDAKKVQRGSRYIYVSLPASDFQGKPNDGDKMTITGPLKWPYEIAVIDQP